MMNYHSVKITLLLKNFLVLLLFCFALTTQAATDCDSTTEIPQAECETLLALYQQTDGANWKNNKGWQQTATPCDWYGITCDDFLGSVIDIDLSYNRLKGQLPDLSLLTELGFLILTGNQLTGGLLGNHLPEYLEIIDIGDNTLSGPLPDLSQHPFFYSLDYSHNQFSGPINAAHFPNTIEEIYLDHNQLTGPVPNLTALTYLMAFSAAGNQLQGSLSRTYFPETLEALYLNHNQLTGALPELTHLTALSYLELSNNQFTGPLPTFPAHLANLNLGHNQLTDEVDLNYVTQLHTLRLEHNQLSGPFPQLTALAHLGMLDLSFNQFYGDIPFSLLTLSKKLITLKLEHNHLTTFNATLIDFLNARDPRWFYQISNSEYPIELPYNLITMTKIGEGLITDNRQLYCGNQCSSVYEYGHTLTLEITPNRGYTFAGWQGCSEQFIVTQPKHCTAIFEPKTPLTSMPALPPTMGLTVKIAGSGSVYSEPLGSYCTQENCQYTYKTASWIKLTPQAHADAEFIGWGDTVIVVMAKYTLSAIEAALHFSNNVIH